MQMMNLKKTVEAQARVAKSLIVNAQFRIWKTKIKKNTNTHQWRALHQDKTLHRCSVFSLWFFITSISKIVSSTADWSESVRISWTWRRRLRIHPSTCPEPTSFCPFPDKMFNSPALSNISIMLHKSHGVIVFRCNLFYHWIAVDEETAVCAFLGAN